MHISSKCSLAVHCLIFIHEYGEETKVTSELLALSTGSNPVTIRSLLSALKKDGMIEVRSGSGGARLCCPPEEITLFRILRAVEPHALEKMIGVHTAPSPLCPVGRNIHAVLSDSYQKLQQDLQKSMETVTLPEILKDYHRRQQTENL